MIKKLLYYLNWGIQRVFLKKRTPINSSIILTDECNLNCKHCTVAHLGYEKRTIKEIEQDLTVLFNTGSRILVITGGEPLMWRDDRNKSVEDVVAIARDMGFFRVVICTNGTYPLESSADYLWVSLDGFEADHNVIRGSHYKTVTENILKSSHKGIHINFTISNNNCNNFNRAAENIIKLKKVQGILFHIYTKYLGGDESLELNKDVRKKVLDDIWTFKKKHPIKTFNTFAGVQALKKGNWKRPVWGSVLINQGVLSECCCRTGIYDDKVCQNCGCSPAVETWTLQSMNPITILENLRYL